MLNALPIAPAGGKSLGDAAWIDLVDPTPPEIAAFEKAFGLRVPTKDKVSEIETTSRLQVEHDALYMTAPIVIAAAAQPWIGSPTGFLLSKSILMTVRFATSAIFDAVKRELSTEGFEPTNAFVRILEELVDHMADLLEESSRDLDDASHAIFRQDDSKHLSRETSLLRELMFRTGRTSERMARVHYTLVCLDRMAAVMNGSRMTK
jgi:magnesium transporter